MNTLEHQKCTGGCGGAACYEPGRVYGRGPSGTFDTATDSSDRTNFVSSGGAVEVHSDRVEFVPQTAKA